MPTFEGRTVQQSIEKGLKALKLSREEVTVVVLDEGKKGGFLGFGRKPAVVQVDATPKPVSLEKPKDQKPQPIADTPRNAGEDAVAQADKADPETKQKTPKATAKPAPKAKKASGAKQGQQQRPSRKADNKKVLKDLEAYITSICATLETPVQVKVAHARNEVVYQLDTNKEGLVIGKHGRTINSLQYLAQTYFNHFGRGKLRIVLNVGNYRQRREDTLKHLADRAAREVIATGKPYLLDDMPSFERKVIHQQLANNNHVDTTSEGKEPHRYVIISPSSVTKF
ncbi:R3H domain protein [Agrilactobacillus composti DSM 18527 = JCM 14202]|uniref:RNA-binding protein KhpB n=1 Tax=Agrilactobacillus composti DSM 18527 = JCM 14202 TaxID=1423734 RepID=A0A0R1XY84_9LACO|nr:RNA-binding cell elongation regulator Jag/EloR [Agrilactobacillus composti]KRM35010.1 R3H domain protein [Agrilactobacillus composti DSM 18527 = JCM 14202]